MSEQDCNNPANWGSCIGKSITQGATDDFAKSMDEGFDKVFKEFATSWIGQGILVDLSGSTVEWFRYSLSIVTAFLVVVGLIIAGGRVAYYHRGEEFGQVMRSLFRLVFVATAGTATVTILLLLGDSYGKWILESSGLNTTTFAVSASISAMAPGLAIVLGLFGMIAVLCQWGIMLVRGALLPLLIGFWPVATAGAMIKGGEGAFDAVTKWILAFVIYSPIAASIYALAWRLNSGAPSIGGLVNSVILIFLAVLALPALMRLLAPVSSAMGRATGGGMAMGVTTTALAAGVAVGAAVATSGAGAAAGGSAAASGGGGAVGARTAAGASTTTSTQSAGATGAAGDKASGAQGPSGASGAKGSDGAPGASSSVAGDSNAGGGAAGGNNGSGTAWRAAEAATQDRGNNNTAEGMVSE